MALQRGFYELSLGSTQMPAVLILNDDKSEVRILDGDNTLELNAIGMLLTMECGS